MNTRRTTAAKASSKASPGASTGAASAPAVSALVWHDTPSVSERIVTALTRLGAALRSVVWQFAVTEGLNPTQVEMLERLHGRHEGVRLTWLAQQLGISTASASDSVAALVSKGLVEKRAAADDARAVALHLSAAGQAMVRRFARALGGVTQALDELPESTQQAVFSSLLAVVGQLQSAQCFPEIRTCVTCKYFEPNAQALRGGATGGQAVHRCAFVDAPLPQALLRLDCPEHEPAPVAVARRHWGQIQGR